MVNLIKSLTKQVDGMEVGLTLGLEIQEGTLKLFLVECGCSVQDISIKLDGGASWLYQGYVSRLRYQRSSSRMWISLYFHL